MSKEEPKGLVPRPHINTEPIPVGNLRLGEKWLFIQKQLMFIENAIIGSESLSSPADLVVATSVFQLIDQTVEEDRSAFFQQDLHKLIEEAQKQGWNDETVNTHLVTLAWLYSMSPEAIRLQLTDYQMNNLLGRGVLLPKTHADLETSSKEIRLRYYHFTDLRLTASPNEAVIRMRAVYDGGIDHVAYPLHELTITFRQGQALESDFPRQIMFFRRTELSREFQGHPEVVEFLKSRFTQIVNLYRTDQEVFLSARDGRRGEKDITRIDSDLYEYLVRHYFPKYLTKDQLRQFHEAKKYLESPHIEALARIKRLYGELFEPDSYLNKDDFYATKNRNILMLVRDRTEAILRELGCILENGEIKNAEEIASKVSSNKRYAKQILKGWDRIFEGGSEDSVVMRMIEEEIERWSHIDQYDIHQRIYQQALEWVRDNRKGS